MNNSAFRFSHASSAAPSTLVAAATLPAIPRRLSNDITRQMLTAPVPSQPLLEVQRYSLQSTPVLCICANVTETQRYYLEAASALGSSHCRPIILHEYQPLFQQEYTLDCIRAWDETAGSCPVVLFTTASYYHQLLISESTLLSPFRIVRASECDLASHSRTADVPAVTCICLRATSGGRWLLMDHADAAIVNGATMPDPESTQRLLRHTVSITGTHLAPYLAMMFDVPQAWKPVPALNACSLLIFHNDECPTGCHSPGIPPKIIWSDTLGILY